MTGFTTQVTQEDDWQIATVTADGIHRTLRFRDGEVRFSITTGNPNGKGIHCEGDKALREWFDTGGLDDVYPGIADFVVEWYAKAVTALHPGD